MAECEHENDGRQAWFDNAARICRCCPFCSSRPCDGCLAGGVCDRMRCTCEDDEALDLDGEDGSMAGACDECSGPADGPGDAECVNCDCGAVVCSACCESHDGESYCPTCARDLRRREVEQRALDAWHGTRSER